jgi:putative transposase
MARPLRIQFPGAHYHITCRGIERRNIYLDNRDRHKFLTLLADSLDIYQVVLYAYITMNNHFHLLIQTRKANCSEFMRHFNIRYTGWFNWRHARSGNLYQGRYHAYLVDADNYLLEVSRYVHLNPVRVKQSKSISWRERWQKAVDYPWSSLSGYVSDTSVLDFVDYGRLLSMAGGRDAYRKFVRDGLKRGFESPFKHVRSRMILGDGDFTRSVKRYLRRVSAREQPAYREMINVTLEPEVVLGILRREGGIDDKLLEQRGVNGIIRGIVAELFYKYSEITQAEIGRLLGEIDYMSVYQLRSRLKRKMAQDSEVRARFRELEMKLRQLMSNV